MNPNNELDRERLMKAIENSTILPHHRAAGQGNMGGGIRRPACWGLVQGLLITDLVQQLDDPANSKHGQRTNQHPTHTRLAGGSEVKPNSNPIPM